MVRSAWRICTNVMSASRTSVGYDFLALRDESPRSLNVAIPVAIKRYHFLSEEKAPVFWVAAMITCYFNKDFASKGKLSLKYGAGAYVAWR